MSGSLEGVKLKNKLLQGEYTSASLDAALAGSALLKGTFSLMMLSRGSARQLVDDPAIRDVVWGSSEAMALAGTEFLQAAGTVAFVFGGQESAGQVDTVESYALSTPTVKGVTPAVLGTARRSSAAAGNFTNAFVFGGGLASAGGPVTTVENYVFATPGTKGTAGAALAVATTELAAAGNASVAFVFGGYAGAPTSACEHYVYATPGTKGATPAAMSSTRQNLAAASNASNAFLFGGNAGSWVNTTENYVFATPTTKGTAPAALSAGRGTMASAANATNAFVFGGHDGSVAAVSTVENYQFNVLATKGVAPAVLSQARTHPYAAGGASTAFVFGGYATFGSNHLSSVESYQFNAPGTKGAAPAALSAARASASAASNRSFI